MALSQEMRRSLFTLVVLLALQLLTMSFSARDDENVSTVEALTMRVTSPFIRLSSWFGGGLAAAYDSTASLFSAHTRAARAEREHQRLATQLQGHREIRAENERLRRLLEMREALAPRSVTARVIGARMDANERIVVVDRGADDGVVEDLPVVTWGGAVGKTLTVARDFTKVRLLNDPSSGVGGLIQRSRAQGTVAGTVDGERLEMLYVPRFADSIHGDRVVSSGMDGIFPAGFGIGRIVSIRVSPAAGTQTIQLEPEIDYRTLEEVLILLDGAGSPLLRQGGRDSVASVGEAGS